MDRFCVAVAVFFLITIPNLVNAEDKHVLSIGIGTGYPPYYYKSDGKLKGVCIEIVDGVCARLGMQAEYVEYPWRRLLLSAKKGEVDAILPLFKTEERQEFLRFGDLELAYEEVYLFVEKGSSLERQNHEQLLLNPIGVVAGYSYGPRFDELENITKVTTQSDMHQIRMFSHNRFSVGIGNRFVVTHYAQQVGIRKQIAFVPPPLAREPLYMGFSRKGKNIALFQSFNRALVDFRQTDHYREIVEQYGFE